MSTLTQFVGGSPIKSIQRGTITIAGNNTSATATISSVNTSKSMVSFLGSNTGGSGLFLLGRVGLTNATTVTATKHSTEGVSETVVSYEVIEFN
jgi:hypothetical protein